MQNWGFWGPLSVYKDFLKSASGAQEFQNGAQQLIMIKEQIQAQKYSTNLKFLVLYVSYSRHYNKYSYSWQILWCIAVVMASPSKLMITNTKSGRTV